MPDSNSQPTSVLGQLSRERALRDSAWVAEFLNVPTAWVAEAADAGTLPCIRVGAAVRFDPDVIKTWGRGERRGQSALAAEPEPVRAMLDEIRQALLEREGLIPSSTPAVTINETMRRLGCGRVKVFQLLKLGALKKAQRVGRKTLVTSDSIDEVLRTPAQPPPGAPRRRKSAGASGWTPMDIRRLRA